MKQWGLESCQGPSPAQSPSPFSQRNWNTPSSQASMPISLSLQGWAPWAWFWAPVCMHFSSPRSHCLGAVKQLPMSHAGSSSSRSVADSAAPTEAKAHSFHPHHSGLLWKGHWGERGHMNTAIVNRASFAYTKAHCVDASSFQQPWEAGRVSYHVGHLRGLERNTPLPHQVLCQLRTYELQMS